MLGYVGQTDSARKEHQQRLNEPPRAGVRNWRTEMSEHDREAFEAIAGALLGELGYEVSARGHDRARSPSTVRGRRRGGAWVGSCNERPCGGDDTRFSPRRRNRRTRIPAAAACGGQILKRPASRQDRLSHRRGEVRPV